MRPRPFEYYAPTTIEEALKLLEEKEDAKLLAGGQSLLALMKLRIISPPVLIDLNRIDDLRYIEEKPDGWLAIGAMTIYDDVEQSSIIRKRYPLLWEAVYRLGDQQIRNRGTIGGGLVEADPSGNLPPVAVALKAQLVAMGKDGTRTIPAEEFFVDAFTTALEPNEILTEVRIPPWPEKASGAYVKLSRREIDYPIVEVAVQLALGDEDEVREMMVVLGAVASTPYRATATEEMLVGKSFDEDLVAKAAEECVKDLEPPSDVQASSWYRKEVSKVIVKRAIVKAWKRAMGVDVI